MGDIYCFYASVPETEPVIADNYINCIFRDYPFEPYVFKDDMVKKQRYFNQERQVLGQEPGISRAETGEAYISQPGHFGPKE